jgi:hypothetical protein
MVNTARRQRERDGVLRPGPIERAGAVRLEEQERTATMEAARARKASQRVHERQREEDVQLLASERLQNGVEDHMSVRDLNRVSLRIAQYIVGELRSCPGPLSRRDVVEKVMRHNTIWPLLPVYYPRPQDAKVMHGFIENYKNELQLVKMANSNELLARKSALLDAAVSLGVDGVTALSRVLDTSAGSINIAMNRRVYGLNPEEAVPRLHINHLKREGLSDYIKLQIELWWNNQTRVSPNKKDLVKHRIGRNLWVEPHPHTTSARRR